MRILNIMFGVNAGGLEQVCVDYTEALTHQGHVVTTLIRRGAFIRPQLQKLDTNIVDIQWPYAWNIFASAKIKKLLDTHDVAILHGNRAGKMIKRLDKKYRAKILPVAHSRFFKGDKTFDGLIVLSEEGQKLHGDKIAGPVFTMPNLVRVPKDIQRPPVRNIPVIGTMGRFSHEKGMDLFIEALGLLKKENIPFHAVMGGDGGIKETLQKQMTAQGLQNDLSFVGWVKDKKKFFESIDIFCLTSRTETFGLTVIEAQAHGVPTLATRCGGSSFIITDGVNGWLSNIDAVDIASQLKRILQDRDNMMVVGARGRDHALNHYDMSVVGAQLDKILRAIVADGSNLT